MPDVVLRIEEDMDQFWSTLILKSWIEDLLLRKEKERKEPEIFEKDQNQWKKSIISRSDWSTVWNISERSSTGKCPKKPSDSGLFMTLAKALL